MIRTVCLGLGALGFLSAQLLAERDDVELVGGVDPDPASRDRFETAFEAPAYESEAALLDGVDADFATITTPHTLHEDSVRTCLAAGLHVHVEKPFVTDAAAGEELIEMAAETDRLLAVGYQRHLDPRYQELKRLVDDGRIGTPHMAACFLEQDWVSFGGWRLDPALSGGGQLFDSGSHLLDALLWITDADPVAVSALTDDRGQNVEVNAALSATLERDDGRFTASIGVTGDGQSGPDPNEEIHVWGTEGSLSFDGRTITVTEGGVPYATTPPARDFETLTKRKLDNVVDAVVGADSLAVPASHGQRVVELTLAAYEAADRGRRVEIEDLY
ncbi:Gfo/Idh/MocA family protein [Haloferacaceae archaeon DSL9]